MALARPGNLLSQEDYVIAKNVHREGEDRR
jgi:hypothetical protein